MVPKLVFVAVSRSPKWCGLFLLSFSTGFYFYAHYWLLHYIQAKLSKDSAICEKTCSSNALVSDCSVPAQKQMIVFWACQ